MSLIGLMNAFRNFLAEMDTYMQCDETPAKAKSNGEEETTSMVIIAVFGGLVAGGAIFAFLKSSGGKSEANYTKLNIV
jgi:hypothetical protein